MRPAKENPPLSLPRHGGIDEAAMFIPRGFPLEKVRDFSISINPLGPPPGLVEALSPTLKEIIGYPEIDAKTLTGELAAFHGLSSDAFIVGNGSIDLLFSLIPLLPNKRAVIPYPTFIEYERVCAIYGWDIHHVPPTDLDTFETDVQTLLSHATPESTLFLCQPNNPSGLCLDSDHLERLLVQTKKKGTFVILDEAFLPFTERPSTIPWIQRHPSLIILRSMTKTYGIPGLRLGYAVAAPAIITRWKQFLPPWNVNTLAQRAGLYCLRHGGSHLKKSKGFIQEERNRLSREIDRLPGLRSLPSEANFFLISVDGNTLTADNLTLSLGRQGLLIRHCGTFRGMGNRHVRIGLKTRPDNQILLAALRDALTAPGDGSRAGALKK